MTTLAADTNPAGRDAEHPTYHDFADDLRALADQLDALADQLPMKRYSDQGISIMFSMDHREQVEQAAEAFGISLDEDPYGVAAASGHTDATVDIGTVHAHFNHITRAHMAQYHAQQERFQAMVDTEDAAVAAAAETIRARADH